MTHTPGNRRPQRASGLVGAALTGVLLAMPALTMADENPRHGGSVTINVHSDAPSLDPLANTSFGNHYRLGPAYNRLIDWTTGAEIGYGEFVPRPSLADSWEISTGGLTYTFNLRQDVVWHDIPPVSGRRFTSADVVATYEAVRAEGVQRGLLSAVERIEAPDDSTLVLHLSRPYAPMIHNLAHQNLWVLPAEAFDGSYDRSETVIGTGPFVMAEHQPGVQTHYVRNEAYFETDPDGRQLPYLDEVTILPLTDLNARINAFRSGQIDIWFGPLSLVQLGGIRSAVPGLQEIQTVANTQTEMFLNPSFEPLSDLRVRRAINIAIDRVNMGQTVRGGGELGGIVAPALASQTQPIEERMQHYGSPDPDAARALLAEAGYPDGFSAEILVLNFGEEYMREVEWVQQDLAEVGIDVTLRVVDTASGISLAQEGAFEMLYLIMSPFSEADDYFFNHFDANGPRNYTDVDDAQLNSMIAAQRSESDPDARLAIIHEIQRYVHDNILNPLPMWAAVLLHPVQQHVRDYHPIMTQGFPMLSRVWVAAD